MDEKQEDTPTLTERELNFEDLLEIQAAWKIQYEELKIKYPNKKAAPNYDRAKKQFAIAEAVKQLLDEDKNLDFSKISVQKRNTIIINKIKILGLKEPSEKTISRWFKSLKK